MDNAFYQLITRFVADNTTAVFKDPRKCRALLGDYSRGEYKREIGLLMLAVEGGLPQKIQTAQDIKSAGLQLVQQMQDDHAITEQAARDVVGLLLMVLRSAHLPEVPKPVPKPVVPPRPVVSLPPRPTVVSPQPLKPVVEQPPLPPKISEPVVPPSPLPQRVQMHRLFDNAPASTPRMRKFFWGSLILLVFWFMPVTQCSLPSAPKVKGHYEWASDRTVVDRSEWHIGGSNGRVYAFNNSGGPRDYKDVVFVPDATPLQPASSPSSGFILSSEYKKRGPIVVFVFVIHLTLVIVLFLRLTLHRSA